MSPGRQHGMALYVGGGGQQLPLRWTLAPDWRSPAEAGTTPVLPGAGRAILPGICAKAEAEA